MTTADRRLGLTLSLCFLSALIEGFDLQAAGVVAPGIRGALGLTPSDLGLFFTAGTLGLIPGALLGGRIADRHGRKVGLITALLLFAICCFATAFAPSFSWLLILRFLTGVGLGGGLPNLVAIAAEAVSAARRSTAVAVMFAGLPTGGALAGLFVMFGRHGPEHWRAIFTVGGVAPLLLAPILALALPRSTAAKVAPELAPRETIMAALFGPESRYATPLLWIAFFLSLLMLYLVLNWLPSLLTSRGLTPTQAGQVQMTFNLCGAVASIGLGRAMDGARPALTVGLAYVLVIGALVALANLPPRLDLLLTAGAFLGIGLLGAQSILYGLSPKCYPSWTRGRGVGAAVAMGRAGSVTGPLIAGGLVAAGQTASSLLTSLLPIAAAAMAAVIILVARFMRPSALS